MESRFSAPGVSPADRTYSRDAMVAQLFASIAEQAPANAALLGEEGSWSYAELLVYARAVQALLAQHGQGKGAVVGIAARRSFRTVGGLLGILFAGAAYLPLDLCGTPAALLTQQVRAAGMRVMLAEHTPATLPSGLDDVQVLTLPSPGVAASSAESSIVDTSKSADAREPDAASAAYIMFTSGSTGTPKGVVVPHRAIARLVRGQSYLHFGADERFLLHSPLNFDGSTLELWGPLLHGGSVVLAPNRTLAIPDFGELIATHGVTTLWLTAATFHLLARHAPGACAPLRQLIVGGDVISPAAISAVQQACPGLHIVNGYGPTESTTFALTYSVPEPYVAGADLPIGTPIAYTTAHVLDERGQPVPDGTEGELTIGGDGIALGYVGEPALTAQRFVADPFSREPGARMYLTGDRVMRDADGLVHFRGRMDQETKIAGHRVDVHELEALLAGHPGVQHAAVFVRGEHAEEKRLAAACELTASVGTSLTEKDLREYLAARLPRYAVPATIAIVPALPINANGKLDRVAILNQLAPAHPASGVSSAIVAPAAAPADALGSVLAIWKELLETDDVSPDQNFFDAGGDSLLLIQLHFRLTKLDCGKLDLMDLFSATTPRKMAALLRAPAPVAG